MLVVSKTTKFGKIWGVKFHDYKQTFMTFCQSCMFHYFSLTISQDFQSLWKPCTALYQTTGDLGLNTNVSCDFSPTMFHYFQSLWEPCTIIGYRGSGSPGYGDTLNQSVPKSETCHDTFLTNNSIQK